MEIDKIPAGKLTDHKGGTKHMGKTMEIVKEKGRKKNGEDI